MKSKLKYLCASKRGLIVLIASLANAMLASAPALASTIVEPAITTNFSVSVTGINPVDIFADALIGASVSSQAAAFPSAFPYASLYKAFLSVKAATDDVTAAGLGTLKDGAVNSLTDLAAWIRGNTWMVGDAMLAGQRWL